LYPAGYVAGGRSAASVNQETILNVIYNVADLVNKVAFGMAIWYSASSQLEREKQVLQLAQLPSAAELLGQKTWRPIVEPAEWFIYKEETEALQELTKRAKEEMAAQQDQIEQEIAEEQAIAARAAARRDLFLIIGTAGDESHAAAQRAHYRDIYRTEDDYVLSTYLMTSGQQ